MCIIVAKPAGIQLPRLDTLNNCHSSNRDGIGFAFNLPGGRPVISKGFMEVKKLLCMWRTLNLGPEHNILLHFRTGTHGDKDQGNCHPFPLTNNFENMRELYAPCDVAVTHNGVFGGMKTHSKYSDTMKFIGGILASPEIIANLQSKPVVELIRGYCGHTSKLAFLQSIGISMIGNFEEDEGIFYSNSQYKNWNHGWASNVKNYSPTGSAWCNQHQTYDLCHRELSDKTYCYQHKEWDYCEYCVEHERRDECAHSKKQLELMDMRIITCEWCKGKDSVKYDKELDANLCDNCMTMNLQGCN